jgi:hypothetical protein
MRNGKPGTSVLIVRLAAVAVACCVVEPPASAQAIRKALYVGYSIAENPDEAARGRETESKCLNVRAITNRTCGDDRRCLAQAEVAFRRCLSTDPGIKFRLAWCEQGNCQGVTELLELSADQVIDTDLNQDFNQMQSGGRFSATGLYAEGTSSSCTLKRVRDYRQVETPQDWICRALMPYLRSEMSVNRPGRQTGPLSSVLPGTWEFDSPRYARGRSTTRYEITRSGDTFTMLVIAERLPLDDPWGADGRWNDPRCIDGTRVEVWEWTLYGTTIQGTYRNDDTSRGCKMGHGWRKIHSSLRGTIDPDLITVHLEYGCSIGLCNEDLRKVE